MRQTLSVNALRHCHLSRRERQERSNAGAGRNTPWLPPLGELSPQVTERAVQGNTFVYLPESTNVGDGLRTSRKLLIDSVSSQIQNHNLFQNHLQLPLRQDVG